MLEFITFIFSRKMPSQHLSWILLLTKSSADQRNNWFVAPTINFHCANSTTRWMCLRRFSKQSNARFDEIEACDRNLVYLYLFTKQTMNENWREFVKRIDWRRKTESVEEGKKNFTFQFRNAAKFGKWVKTNTWLSYIVNSYNWCRPFAD